MSLTRYHDYPDYFFQRVNIWKSSRHCSFFSLQSYRVSKNYKILNISQYNLMLHLWGLKKKRLIQNFCKSTYHVLTTNITMQWIAQPICRVLSCYYMRREIGIFCYDNMQYDDDDTIQEFTKIYIFSIYMIFLSEVVFCMTSV